MVRKKSKVKTACGDTMWNSLNRVVISSEKNLRDFHMVVTASCFQDIFSLSIDMRKSQHNANRVYKSKTESEKLNNSFGFYFTENPWSNNLQPTNCCKINVWVVCSCFLWNEMHCFKFKDYWLIGILLPNSHRISFRLIPRYFVINRQIRTGVVRRIMINTYTNFTWRFKGTVS